MRGHGRQLAILCISTQARLYNGAMGLGDNLRLARKAAGVSQVELARNTGLSQQLISQIENGKNLSTKELPRLATALGVPLSDLDPAYANVRQRRREVPLVGYVGAGAQAHFYAFGDDPAEMVEAPDGATETTVAVEIRGESLGPLFEHWLVYYDDVRSPITPDLIGRLCVVGLPDDRVLVKKIQRARSGLYHLLSNTEAPILDQEVTWAARVKNMVPR